MGGAALQEGTFVQVVCTHLSHSPKSALDAHTAADQHNSSQHNSIPAPHVKGVPSLLVPPWVPIPVLINTAHLHPLFLHMNLCPCSPPELLQGCPSLLIVLPCPSLTTTLKPAPLPPTCFVSELLPQSQSQPWLHAQDTHAPPC